MVWSIRILYILEKMFLIAFVGLLVYAVVHFQKPIPAAGNPMLSPRSDISNITSSQDLAVTDEGFIDWMAARDLFNAAIMPKAINTVANEPSTNSLPVNLKVVGVVLGKPSQLIIEDSNAHQTHFVTEGRPSEGIELVNMDRSQAIIKYQGQEIVLPIEGQ